MKQKSPHFSIKDWAQDDKPREKLLDKGRLTLSDAELIAILIGSGSANESALALAKRLLSSVDHNLNEMGKLSISQLCQFRGIGAAKAASIAAAMEIGRRRREERGIKQQFIQGSQGAYELLEPLIGDLPHEEFWIVYLNNNNRVIKTAQLSKGGITGTLVDVRLVMKQALETGAVGLILAHNHPSGTLKPSAADSGITQKLKKAAEAMDIKVLDHLIIATEGYYSFADEHNLH